MDRPKVGVAVLIVKDDKILIGKRKNCLGEGKWALAGGHLEGGESFEDCCKREVLEETGLIINDVQPAMFSNEIFKEEDKHYVTLYFSAQCESGEVENLEPDKCEEWRWVTSSDIPSPLFEGLNKLLDQFIGIGGLY